MKYDKIEWQECIVLYNALLALSYQSNSLVHTCAWAAYMLPPSHVCAVFGPSCSHIHPNKIDLVTQWLGQKLQFVSVAAPSPHFYMHVICDISVHICIYIYTTMSSIYINYYKMNLVYILIEILRSSIYILTLTSNQKYITYINHV